MVALDGHDDRRIYLATKAAKPKPATPARQIQHLRELIEALDRRLPQMERVGELQIARDAAALKKRALARLADLEKQ